MIFRKLNKRLDSLKSEFTDLNDSLDFVKKISLIITALIVTSTIILVVKGE